ncbi:flavin-dependent thymidylate synthase [Cellulophaga phage phi14:2]|uniref:thymidylate synthase n=1 Tax=Cellulophaga phage phi14:2 TaxID=1327990 RepID=S0A0M0_9CAUD|nr:flavin-dependent thymidylate synthase [Cellulophaga phage phi14:2]AGO48921.1 thymidylate synthase [Cellulophaga phage phi14:2]
MAKIDKTYHDLLLDILQRGYTYEDPNRKGVNRIQISSATIEHNFKDGFPAITTKKLYWKGIVGELLWILRGDTNIKYLVDNNINIWNKDAYNYYLKAHEEECATGLRKYSLEQFIKESKTYNGIGNIGRGYGAQLRGWRFGAYADKNSNVVNWNYGDIDQFAELINTLKTNPMATKKTVTFWNPAEKDQCALTPCHWSFEVLVEPLSLAHRDNIRTTSKSGLLTEENYDELGIPKYQFTLKWHQHSVDTFLGLPFNIASYALLAQIIGKMTNMVPKGIIGDLSNVHIYEPHLDAVKEQLNRNVDKHGGFELVHLKTDDFYNSLGKDLSLLNHLNLNDFEIKGYKSYPIIAAEMLAYNK